MRKQQISYEVKLVLTLLQQLLKNKKENNLLKALVNIRKTYISNNAHGKYQKNINRQKKQQPSIWSDRLKQTQLINQPIKKISSDYQLIKNPTNAIKQPPSQQINSDYQLIKNSTHTIKRPPSQQIYYEKINPYVRQSRQSAHQQPYYRNHKRKNNTIISPVNYPNPSRSLLSLNHSRSNYASDYHDRNSITSKNDKFEDMILDKLSDIESKVSGLMQRSYDGDPDQNNQYIFHKEKVSERRKKIHDNLEQIRSFKKIKTPNISDRFEKKFQNYYEKRIDQINSIKQNSKNIQLNVRKYSNKILQEDINQEDYYEKSPKFIDFKPYQQKKEQQQVQKKNNLLQKYIKKSGKVSNKYFPKNKVVQNQLKLVKGVLVREKISSNHQQQLDFIDQSEIQHKTSSKSIHQS